MIKTKSDGRIIRARCKTIGKHINNALKEELLTQTAAIANFAIVQKEGERSVLRQIAHYYKVKINIQLRLLRKCT